MSMPNIPDITPIIDLDRDEAITLLLASIAVEEMGLAHILNAEGEKLQYVMGLKNKSSVCVNDILAVNESVERVLKSVTRLQLILESKLENVVRLIPKEPCPNPYPPQQLCCTLLGNGVGCVRNKKDDFYGATATLEIIEPCDKGHHPLKYTLFKRGKGRTLSAVLIPFSRGLKVECPSLKPCPTPENPNVLSMQGKGTMCITGLGDGTHRATVNFKLKVWDYGLRQEFQMITWLDSNGIFNHDSGIVAVTQGNLLIKPLNSCDTY